jgi:hypothetical protein
MNGIVGLVEFGYLITDRTRSAALSDGAFCLVLFIVMVMCLKEVRKLK